MEISGSKILTYTGNYIDLENPDYDSIFIDDITNSLSKICRFTGHTKRFYSVAEHSIFVSFLVPEKLALPALLHDATEAYLGDVSSPLKSILPEYKIIEQRMDDAINKKFGIELSDNDRYLIKRADMIMLSTERKYLMYDCGNIWLSIKDIEPVKFSGEMNIDASSVTSALMFNCRFNEIIKNERIYSISQTEKSDIDYYKYAFLKDC